MSAARRRVRVSSALDSMTDRRLPGSCDDCDSYQLMTKQSDGFYMLAVHHDESCPQLRGATR